MHYLVIDGRYGTPIYAFFESDPRESRDYPGLVVREVTVELVTTAGVVTSRIAVGCDPLRPDRYREFLSDGAVGRAGYILVEPRYVGETWDGYVSQFRPEGEGKKKRPRVV